MTNAELACYGIVFDPGGRPYDRVLSDKCEMLKQALDLSHKRVMELEQAIADSKTEKWPECYEFFDLMQNYRHIPMTKPIEVKAAYEAVKEWLRANPEEIG